MVKLSLQAKYKTLFPQIITQANNTILSKSVKTSNKSQHQKIFMIFTT